MLRIHMGCDLMLRLIGGEESVINECGIQYIAIDYVRELITKTRLFCDYNYILLVVQKWCNHSGILMPMK